MDGQVKAIIPQGIVRNQTKIGVQDGQAEDIINLRCVNGSWRASGDGMYVYNTESSGYSYSQLYIHTNVYKHLLGVRDGQLWWFAEIENDGVSFTTLDTPVSIASVKGDLWITQTGHMLTIIDSEDDFVYVIFKKGDNKYIEVKIDANGKQTDRSLYPFGQVHFNFITEETDEYLYTKEDKDQCIINDYKDTNIQDSPSLIPKENESTTHDASLVWFAQMLSVYKEATEENRFTDPFVAISAIKLYDGSYLYTSQPTLINPRERVISENIDNANMRRASYINEGEIQEYNGHSYIDKDGYIGKSAEGIFPLYTSSASTLSAVNGTTAFPLQELCMKSTIGCADLVVSIDNVEQIIQNKDIFLGIGIFVTPQSTLYDMSNNAYKEGVVRLHCIKNGSAIGSEYVISNASYYPKQREQKDIVDGLMRTPFFLLREYDTSELSLLGSIKIDMSSDRYKGVLSNITSQKTLPIEATIRQTYIPKVSYEYNSRLHIANYKTHPFFGYPIDLFHLHNHSVKVEKGAWFKGVLPNLVANNDEYQQFSKEQVSINTYQDLIDAKSPYFLVRVHIETSQGDQVVSRYIQAYDTTTTQEGRADFIEDLNPLLTYPDSRAKKMEIFYVKDYIAHIDGVVQTQGEGVFGKKKTFELKPHPYLNLAYYISPDLKPIKLADFENFKENASLE